MLQNILALKGVFPTGLGEKINTTSQQLPSSGVKLALGSDTFKNAAGIYIHAYVLNIVQNLFTF